MNYQISLTKIVLGNKSYCFSIEPKPVKTRTPKMKENNLMPISDTDLANLKYEFREALGQGFGLKATQNRWNPGMQLQIQSVGF